MHIMDPLRRLYYNLLNFKKKSYLSSLARNGLQLGKEVVLMDGFFLDPSHCYLISIGDHCVLAPGVRLIAHDASAKQFSGYTRVGKIHIENDCFIGDSTIVLPGVTIGEGTIIGAGSVVTKNIPAGSVAAGNPCRVICQRVEYDQQREKDISRCKIPFAELEQRKLTIAQKETIRDFLESGSGYIR